MPTPSLKLFKDARSNSICMIFIDAVGCRRVRGGVVGNDERDSALDHRARPTRRWTLRTVQVAGTGVLHSLETNIQLEACSL